MLDLFLELDKILFLFLNSLNTGFLDPVMYYISYKYTWIPLYAFLAVLLGIRYRWKAFAVVLFVVLLITLSDQISVFIKNYFERLRPCHETDISPMVHLVRGRCGGSFGFVSSHAANTFAMAIFMGKMLRDKFGFVFPVLIVWASLNAYSRVYLGVHYPGDVFFGALLGVVIAYAVYVLWIRSQKLFNDYSRIAQESSVA